MGGKLLKPRSWLNHMGPNIRRTSANHSKTHHPWKIKMQFKSFTTSSLATILTLTASASAATCSASNTGIGNSLIHYDIWADNVIDSKFCPFLILTGFLTLRLPPSSPYTKFANSSSQSTVAGQCRGLWANLQNRDCPASNTYCGGIEATHILNWSFDSSLACNGGSVDAAWGLATDNNWGAISC